MDNSRITASDRCDRCGAPAHARTAHEVVEKIPHYPKDTVTVGGVVALLWCVHHFRKHSEALIPFLVWQSPEIAQSVKTPTTPTAR